MQCYKKMHWIAIETFVALTFTTVLARGLHWNRLEPVSISHTNPTVTLETPAEVPSNTGFVQLQAHLGPEWPINCKLSLSTQPDFGVLYTVNGRHTGLVSLNASIATWYMRLSVPGGGPTQAPTVIGPNATAWVLFVAKSWHEPIPGGCDLTSPVPNPPGLAASQVISPGVAWRLRFALAGSFNPASRVKESCNTVLSKAAIRYRLYALQLASHSTADWRSSLERMATAQEAEVYGRLITVEGGTQQPLKAARLDVGARPNVPVIYTIVIEQIDTGQFSAYVPATLDDCAGDYWGENSDGVDYGSLPSCLLSEGIEWRVATITAALVGLFLCTAGFRFFTPSVLICGFASGSLIALPGILRAYASLPGQLWLAYLLGVGVAGVGMALLAVALWIRCKSTVFALLFVNLPCCYLLACTVFATPFGQLRWLMREEYILFLTLTSVLLLVLLLLLLFGNYGAIFALSLVGSYAVTACVSANFLIGSVFPYLFLDLFRRTAYQQYNQVWVSFSMHHNDWILLGAWLGATLICCLLQYYWNRRCLDPSLRGRSQHRRQRQGSGSINQQPTLATERTPLLRSMAPTGISGSSSSIPSPPPYSEAVYSNVVE